MARDTLSIDARTARHTARQRRPSCRPRPWRRDPVPLLLALLPLLVFAPQAGGRRVFSGQDIQYYFLPYHAVAARIIAAGHPPLWNPYAFSGIPLLGDGQTALFYPPTWLFLLPGLPPALALNYAILLQFSIAATATYGFARLLGLARPPAVVAAVSYAFGGFLTARIVHLSILGGAALLPLVFLTVERALRAAPGRAARRAVVLAAAAVALQAAAGHPQLPAYTALALALYVAARALGVARVGGRRPAARLPLRLAGAYALGLALTAVQLLPWIELARLSPRAAGATFTFVFDRSKEGSEWLLFLFPHLFGALRPGPFGVAPDTFTAARVWEQSSYVGILPLALAAVGLLARRTSRVAEGGAAGDAAADRAFPRGALALALLAGALIAAGEHTPLGRVLYVVPVLGRLRDVERAIALASFALALLAGFGLQCLLAPGAWAVGRRARALAGAAPLLAVAGVLLLAQQPAPPAWLAARGVTPDDLRLLRLDRANALLPLALATASAALLFRWPARPAWRRWAGAAAALALADLALFAATFQPGVDPAVYAREPAVATFLRQDGELYRTATFLTVNELDEAAARDRLAGSWAMLYGLTDVNGFNSLQPRRYTDYLFSPEEADVSYGFLRDERLLADDSPVLSALNVKYLLVPKGTQPEPRVGASWRPVWEDAAVRVYENTRVQPRAWFAAAAREEADPRAVLRAVTAPGFDGRREALVEPAGGARPALPAPADPAPGDIATITTYAPDRLTLATVTAAPRVLVLSEMAFPGWRATIDGAPAPLLRANYLFRALVVPPGAHTVTLTYRPDSLRYGALLTGTTLLLAAALLLPGRRPPSP